MTALATQQAHQTAQHDTGPSRLIELAITQGADVEKLERLFELQEKWEAKEAKKAFTEALARFQGELGPIIKTRQAHNTKYADIDDVAQAIRPILNKHGLSYRFEQDQGDGIITIRCVVSHTGGYSVATQFSANADKSGGKNDIQAAASTVTYLRRYTLTGALGITTGNEDTDGGKPEIQVDDLLTYLSVLREEFHSVAAIKSALADGDYPTAKEAWAEVDEETKRVLWRAPTKGGIFTTKEREQMKSNEWAAA